MDISPLSQLQPIYPGFWIVLSLTVWAAIWLTRSRWSQRQLRWLNMARWVLIPYAGLLAGSLSPQLMGLTGIDWRTTLGIGIVALVGVMAVLAVIRFSLQDDHSVSSTAEAPKAPGRPHAMLAIFVTGAEEFHWTFLRGAVWELLLLSQIELNLYGYWAVWIAALIALPEILLQPLNVADRLVNVVILAVTAVLFIFTRNFWLCWAFHTTAWLLLKTAPSPGEEGPATSRPSS